MKTVFLGGTCNDSTWRDHLIHQLSANVSAYNPVVPDWTPECQAEELRQRASSDYCLYVLTPKMLGSYSVAEVVDDSNKRPEKTLFLVLPVDGDAVFTREQSKSMQAVGKLVAANGGKVFDTMSELVHFLNS